MCVGVRKFQFHSAINMFGPHLLSLYTLILGSSRNRMQILLCQCSFGWQFPPNFHWSAESLHGPLQILNWDMRTENFSSRGENGRENPFEPNSILRVETKTLPSLLSNLGQPMCGIGLIMTRSHNRVESRRSVMQLTQINLVGLASTR